MKISDLQERKLTDLKDLARDLNLKGVSTLRKQDLIYRILEHRAKSMAEGKPAQPRRIESSIKSDNSPSKPPPPAIKAESPVRPARTNQRPSTVPSKEPKLPLREPNQSKPTRHKGRETPLIWCR